MTQNPFNKDENLQSWLEKDAEFQKAKKHSFSNFIRQNNLNPNFIMNLKELYLKIVNLITKNVIVATVLMTLVVAGASVTAAEILLPRYKPSSILQGWFETKIEAPVPAQTTPFSNNSQSQKDPNQLLTTDDQNYVFVNHTCGLIFKYPKKFENSITKTMSQNGQVIEPAYDDFSSSIYIFTTPLDNTFGGSGVSMKCSDQKPKKDPFEVKISKEKFQEITGWFVSVADIQEVTVIENTNIPLGYSYSFKYRDLYYSGEFVEKAVGTKEQRNMEFLGGLYATQVQIQLKDQVPNPPQIQDIDLVQ